MSIEQIAKLTDRQIIEIFRQDDSAEKWRSHPDVLPEDEQTEHVGYYSIFHQVWKERGLSEAEIEAKFREDFPGQALEQFGAEKG